MKRHEKHIISIPVIYDQGKINSSAKILIPLTPTNPSVLKAETAYYYAVADGVKRIYTDKDGVFEFGSRKILDPSEVSYHSVFVNGILQSPLNYNIKKGQLQFNTEDVPHKNVLITIQFISIYNAPK